MGKGGHFGILKISVFLKIGVILRQNSAKRGECFFNMENTDGSYKFHTSWGTGTATLNRLACWWGIGPREPLLIVKEDRDSVLTTGIVIEWTSPPVCIPKYILKVERFVYVHAASTRAYTTAVFYN